MSALFLKIVNMSISAGWLVLAVLLLRPLFKKAPKWISVLLWGFVAIRLICPFTIDSVLSLIPSDETIRTDAVTGAVPQVYTGIDALNNTLNPVISETFQTGVISGAYSPEFWLQVASVVWLMGFAAMLIYTVATYMLLRHRVDTAIWQRENIYRSEYVATPFVLGIFRPRIYLPFGIDGNDLDHVIAHEKAHISRKDHWWKPMGFLLLALHWFNPLMWLGYILLCRDIELACDEKVIKDMDSEHKADYTQALVTCSIHRRSIAACPLAFGEVGVRERVRSVLNYKKPTFWILVASIVLCIVVAVCFLTDPTDSYGIGIQSIRGGTYTENNRTPAIELDYFLLLDGEDHLQSGRWIQQLHQDEPERTSNGTIPYDGSLGKYRMLLEFPKTGPSASFRKTHDEGEIYPLEGLPGAFADSVFYKVIYPDAGGMLIYFGSDKPFLFKEPGMYNLRYLTGPVQIRIYGVAEPEPYIAQIPSVTNADTWFEFTTDWDNTLEKMLECFRNVTFRAKPGSVEAVTSKGTKTLYTGNPIWNTFFADLTHDGYPEFCATVSRGSGIVDTYVVVYDYVKDALYTLEDRMNYDYQLHLDRSDGELKVDKRRYSDGVTVTTDVLLIVDGKLQLLQDVQTPVTSDVLQAITTDITVYYRLKDGTWRTGGGYGYQYRLFLTGRLPNSETETTFVYLSNTENLTFEQAWKAAGLSSNSEDYFLPHEAVLVEWGSSDRLVSVPDVVGTVPGALTDPPTTSLDAAISLALLNRPWSSQKEARIKAETHIILAQSIESEWAGYNREEIVLVYYSKQQFDVLYGDPSECDSASGMALLSFSVDPYGLYTLKEFLPVQSFDDLDLNLRKTLEIPSELLTSLNLDPDNLQQSKLDIEAMKAAEQKYAPYLRTHSWSTAYTYLRQMEQQEEPYIHTPIVECHSADIDGDGILDFCFGTAAQWLADE